MLTYADVCLTERTPGVVKVRKELLALENEEARAKGLWQELAAERDKATASILKKVSIPQHTSAYVSIRQHTAAYVSIRQLAAERDKATASILKKARMLTYADVCCGMLTYADVC
jgi:hypothetical protein